MIIRKATIDDAQVILRLHTRSVLLLCRADYTPEQLDGWVGRNTLERYQIRLKKHRAYIAEQKGNVAGYVRWNPATNELCSIFVDPDYVRQGVGTNLMAKACEDAISRGVEAFWLDASLTAVPFYKAIGWTYVEPIAHGSLPGVRMTKQLLPHG
jgi:putative acetyltransferase